MLLEKTTHYSRSISLSKEEFKDLQEYRYTLLDVYGPKGKLVESLTITPGVLARLIARSRLIPTQHKCKETGDTLPPNQQVWYWVVNL